MAFIGPITTEDEPLFARDNVVLKIGSQDLGPGGLIITERAFMWRPEHVNDGVSIPWTSVSLHAIESQPRSIYMQLDFCLKWPGIFEQHENGNGNRNIANDDGSEEDEGNASDSSEDIVSTEMRVIPQADEDVRQIFYAMNHCQTMNPDPNQSANSDSETDDLMDAGGDESDDAAHGEMQNLDLNGDEDDQFVDD